MRFLSFFDKDLKKILIFAEKNFHVQNDKSCKDLGIIYKPHLKSIRDMKKSFIDFGYIKNLSNSKE